MIALLVVCETGRSILKPCGGCRQDTRVHFCPRYSKHMNIICGDTTG